MSELQISLTGFCPIADAVEALSSSGAEARGAIFTRREVVEFMLDLADYVPSRPLHQRCILEPSFGGGDFLLPVIQRLLAAAKEHGVPLTFDSLESCIRGVELHRESFQTTRNEVIGTLIEEGVPRSDADALATSWLIEGDYLLASFGGLEFDVVVGNPPYVRQELIPDALIQAYRRLYETVYDRADLYVPFIEKSLKSLKKNGSLAFICSDRWMKNRYGSKLRGLVSREYCLRYYIDMVNTDAFNTPVIAYPAITIISRASCNATRLAYRPAIGTDSLKRLFDQLSGEAPANGAVSEAQGILQGEEPWLLETSDQLALVRRLEQRFPLLEDTGCQVGIGVATGADKVFIGRFEDLDVESDRKLRLVRTRDIQSGDVEWHGFGVINPFRSDGGLVDLDEYPRLRAFLLSQEGLIRRRNVAQKNPAHWFRTIDRIYPQLALRPKLLIPDIKGDAHIVHENGSFYPHHNLYYITSDHWDLHALRAVLMSGIAGLFVRVYSTVMHGGFLRFQAQYLRRIRLPHWADVPMNVRKRLAQAGSSGAPGACNDAVTELYALSSRDRAAIPMGEGVAVTNAD